MTKILKSNETADLKLNLLESAVFRFVNDSETISLNKESNQNEKEN
jgi:hypothetical protein